MKKYLSSRDDIEPGSYSSEKIIALQPAPLDGMRDEGRSTDQPNFTQKKETKYTPTLPVLLKLPYRPSNQKLLPGVSAGAVKEVIPASKKFHPAQELKANQNTLQKSRNLSLKKLSGIGRLNTAAVFVGLVLSIFLVKTLVDEWNEKVFNEYSSGRFLTRAPKEKTAGKDYQNALVRIMVPPVSKEKKNHPKPAKLRTIRKQVGIRGNEYTVGYFGGISGLKLTVSNRSGHFINQVEVEVNYLERNGDIIETNTYQVRAMKPHSVQTLSVPPTKKGAKVTYKIMNIYSRQYRSLLKEI